MAKDNHHSLNLITAAQGNDFNIWSPPEMSSHSVNSDMINGRKVVSDSGTVNSKVTAQSVEQIHKAAYNEGLAIGKEEARVEIKKQQQNTESLIALLNECSQQAKSFDQKICEQLVFITIAIAKQVIRRELSVEPEQIMAVIRDAISYLPISSEKIILKLHPEDAVLVREIYHLDDEPERTWKIFEDPGMQRGGCIINTESSVVNADLDNRIATIVSQLLGGERSDD